MGFPPRDPFVVLKMMKTRLFVLEITTPILTSASATMMQSIAPDERFEATTLGVTLCMYLNTKKNRILCALL